MTNSRCIVYGHKKEKHDLAILDDGIGKHCLSKNCRCDGYCDTWEDKEKSLEVKE